MSKADYIGVIGAGSFGTSMANLIAENHKVLLYARRPEVVTRINEQRENTNQQIHDNITAVNDVSEVTGQCELIFPMIPAAYFKDLITYMDPLLRPDHILIHGTKGFCVEPGGIDDIDSIDGLSRDNILTISELIRKETNVIRVGCVSGPNLARELAAHKPAGTVIASHFDEVLERGKDALRSDRLAVFQSKDLIGVELAGALKNIIAIASGALSGLEYGENARALLISKSLGELIRIGKVLGGDLKAFLGLAGIGDIMATASSSTSRNYTVGYRMAKGESLDQILATSEEVAEGINTVKVIMRLARYYKVRVPIIKIVHDALFEDLDPAKGISFLMKYPFDVDVDFLD